MATSVEPPAAPANQPPAVTRGPGTSGFDRFTAAQMNLGIILLGLLLYVPLAGTYGLSAPWETHYGEVARQMAVRHDYISLWWPGAPIDADHFWSKPVLSFWIMSIFMRLFGVAGGAPGAIALGTRAEWAMRLPFCLMSVQGIWGLYQCVSRFAGRRAGVLSALILATSPLYFLVARQAMTDMAFVGPMTMALALGFLALFDDDERDLPRRAWRGLSWPHHPLVYVSVGLFVVSTLPQLIGNCVQLAWPIHFGSHRFNIPGALVMSPYFVGFAAVLRWSARLRRKAPFYLQLAAVLCGLAMLAKGLAGLGLPVLIFLIYLGFTWNWKRLQRAEIGVGVILAFVACAVVAVPWHHAMLVRHGFPFWDELYGDTHWRRLVTGRHGDRGTFEYFLRELGYGFLPWIGLAPAALATAAMRPVRGETRQALFWFGAIWFVTAFAVAGLLLCWRRLLRGGAVGLSLLAAVFTYYLLDHYMPATAAYWSQKHLLATYYQTRRSPSEKLLVWQMYWRGENFYTA